MEETVVEVTCDKGYTMFGDSIIECLAGGTWNTTVPDCVRGVSKQLIHSTFPHAYDDIYANALFYR